MIAHAYSHFLSSLVWHVIHRSCLTMLVRITQVWVACAFLTILFCPLAFSAGFDCEKASTEVETMICADDRISKMDSDLAALYNGLKLHAINKDARTALLASQRAWLKNRNQCVDQDCLVTAYGAQIEWLRMSGLKRSYERVVPRAGTGIVEDRVLCERFVANLRATHSAEVQQCELNIVPQYAKYFNLPKWEELDPSAHLHWLWQMDTDANRIYYIGNGLKRLLDDQRAWQSWFTTGVRNGTHDAWGLSSAWVRSGLQRKQYRHEPPVVGLRRSHFDLDNDGKDDIVLAHRISVPCDATHTSFAGDHLFVFNENKGRILG